LGINTHFRWEKAKPDSAHFEQIPMQKYGVSGFDEYFMLGFGGLVSHDSRDNILYPKKGLFLKTTFTYYPKIGENSYQMGRITVDFRHFVPIYKGLIFAYQFSSEMNFAKEKPFQMLATIGGADIVRGVRQSNWRDDAMVALQTELRIPIWKIFKAAVFAGIGDVYSFENFKWSVPKIGYGVGLRVNFNKSGGNIRIDVTRNNFNNKFTRNSFSCYITMNEAF
jgi:outer membrane protein assembly factor BamA